MFRCFFPDEYLDSTYEINFEKLYQEGYRGLLFDIDNTLVPHGEPADERVKELFVHLESLGFQYCFLSNNTFSNIFYLFDKYMNCRLCKYQAKTY